MVEYHSTDGKEHVKKHFSEEKIEIRKYQIDISNLCVNKNSLVVLPTGLGKTLIAALVTAKTLDIYPPKSKVIVLAPTRPLINQHYSSFQKLIQITESLFYVITGNIAPKNRSQLYDQNQILFYTPHTLRNDLATKKYTLYNTCLIIFDEAHHATGDYPYSLIADEYISQNPDGNILALTASPGASKKRIEELCENLHIPVKNIHMRTRKDSDVKEYLKPMDIFKIGINLTELMKEIYEEIKKLIEIRLYYLYQLGFLEKKKSPLFETIIRKDLLKLNKTLVYLSNNSQTEKTRAYSALSINAQALILYYMIELIEQQGLDILLIYLEKIYQNSRKKNSSKAIKVLTSDQTLRRVYLELKKNEQFSPDNLTHPKFHILHNIIRKEINYNSKSKILVFVKLRDSVKNIVNKLSQYNIIKPVRFVGQANRTKNDKGMTQKEQINILDQFNNGEFNVLVSTNVGEEGLDIAECDIVIFYDVVSSEIRLIQRKGRTARHRKGKVIILYCKDTNDETYLYIALNKLKKMNTNLKNPSSLQINNLDLNPHKQFLVSKDLKITSTKKKKRVIKKISYKNQSGLNRFLFCIPKGMPDIKLSKLLPMDFGLRTKLEEERILFETTDSHIHLLIYKKIAIQIYRAEKLRINGEEIIREFWNSLKKQYKLVIIIISFYTFQDKYEGETRLLKRALHESQESKPCEIITIDTLEELFYIIKNIYTYNKWKEEN